MLTTAEALQAVLANTPEFEAETILTAAATGRVLKQSILAERDQPAMKKFYELGFAKRPADELYDLKNDPDQVNNVASDPAHAGKIKKFRERVISWMKRTADPRAKDPQSLVFDEYKYFGGAPKPSRLEPRKAYVPDL